MIYVAVSDGRTLSFDLPADVRSAVTAVESDEVRGVSVVVAGSRVDLPVPKGFRSWYGVEVVVSESGLVAEVAWVSTANFSVTVTGYVSGRFRVDVRPPRIKRTSRSPRS